MAVLAGWRKRVKADEPDLLSPPSHSTHSAHISPVASNEATNAVGNHKNLRTRNHPTSFQLFFFLLSRNPHFWWPFGCREAFGAVAPESMQHLLFYLLLGGRYEVKGWAFRSFSGCSGVGNFWRLLAQHIRSTSLVIIACNRSRLVIVTSPTSLPLIPAHSPIRGSKKLKKSGHAPASLAAAF